jgi:hypothetical protein
MASSTENVKIGVCRVLYGTAGSEVDLGFTKGGVEFDVTTDTHEVMVDQFGNTPISEYIMARKVSVSVPLAETTLDLMVTVMPGAVLVTDGTTPTKKKVTVPTGIGSNLLLMAKQMILHPVGLLDTDKSEDITIPLCATAGALKFAYKVDDERIFNVEFKAYPDSNGLMFTVGDPTAAP